MSASLVGSEMCIRDSLLEGGCAEPDAALGCERLSGGALPMGEVQHAIPSCLLYTSDAADDM
eukprot:15278960-Alexandrium_andersonii.AAC.1